MRKPAVIAHCDWSMREKKRWMAVAVRRSGRWLISAPEAVTETSSLLKQLQLRHEEPGCLLVGFDFPIGLPVRYGELTRLSNFRQALHEFGKGDWSNWYNVAERRSQISIHRPFYPMRPGGTSRTHLLTGLVLDANGLLRRCEHATDHRKAACMLFWTLGGNQVGKAAISGWKEVIQPNLDVVGLWPFDGSLPDLLQNFPVVVAETYPGDTYGQLGISKKPKWSKRKRGGRQSVASHLLCWLSSRPVTTDEALRAVIEQGFAAGSEGEDQFDAMVGLFGMLDVIEGRRDEGAPGTSEIKKWEGWILGQTAAPVASGL